MAMALENESVPSPSAGKDGKTSEGESGASRSDRGTSSADASDEGSAKSSTKAMFRLLKANDKKILYYLCEDGQIQLSQKTASLVRLIWATPPQVVLIVKKPNESRITDLMIDMATWLYREKGMRVMVEPPVKEEKGVAGLDFFHTWKEDEFENVHKQVDFVVSLGGDGTLLWVSSLFTHACPPVISFAMGSLGFLTHFAVADYKRHLNYTIKGGFYLTLRSRLAGTIVRGGSDPVRSDVERRRASVQPRSKSRSRRANTQVNMVIQEGLSPAKGVSGPSPNEPTKGRSPRPRHRSGFARAQSSLALDRGRGGDALTARKDNAVTFSALNEVLIGNSTALTNLDCYADDVFTTKCQADGLILATPTGSTAYSLSAGGSMVHPQVPGILCTPVCPHSLSFRPIVYPDTTRIAIVVCKDARGQHTVTFDGRNRTQLRNGDRVDVRVSDYPIPAICRVGETEDWFTGVRNLLHWNLRATQKRINKKKNVARED